MDHDPDRNQNDRKHVQRRQAIKIAMAIVLVWIALTSSSDAGSPPSFEIPCDLPCDGPCDLPCDGPCLIPPNAAGMHLQLDGFTPLSQGQPLTITDPIFRAEYAQLFAELSNFDADAAPDGWRAAVVIRTFDDAPIGLPVRATFQLQPRVLRRPRYGIDRNSIRDTARQFIPKLRWTRQLQFDNRGVASVKLPARRSMQKLFDWDLIGDTGWPVRESESYRRFYGRRIDRLRGSRYHRHFVTQDLYDRIDYPSASWLEVRVSIPGQQTLEAVAPVDLRPQVLVDTPYRYR